MCLLHAPDQLYDSEARRQINTLDCMILVNPQQRQKQQAGDAPCSKPTKGGVCNRFVFVEVEGLAGSTPFVHKKENEASSSSHTFNILARIIQESSIALYQLFPATGGGA